jgi:uncharacterized protein YigE (DUF2233 family)
LLKYLLLTSLLLVGIIRLAPAHAEGPCVLQKYDEHSYTVCSFDPLKSDIRLFLNAPSGEPFASYSAVVGELGKSNLRLAFGMNAGKFHSDSSPVGLYIEKGKALKALNTETGDGNFFLKPNGVFFIEESGKAGILETGEFSKKKLKLKFATQSGPLLLDDGKMNENFTPAATSRKIRNGVGLAANGEIKFVISNDPVTFYEFAGAFRDKFATPFALSLDGSLSSSIYAPSIERYDLWLPIGPIVGVVVKK